MWGASEIHRIGIQGINVAEEVLGGHRQQSELRIEHRADSSAAIRPDNWQTTTDESSGRLPGAAAHPSRRAAPPHRAGSSGDPRFPRPGASRTATWPASRARASSQSAHSGSVNAIRKVVSLAPASTTDSTAPPTSSTRDKPRRTVACRPVLHNPVSAPVHRATCTSSIALIRCRWPRADRSGHTLEQ